MKNPFIIVKIDSAYCDYLRNFDNKVPYNSGIKELRPFIGILFNINEIRYFAPLSSPKAKHIKLKNTIDLVKIDEGKLGVININNMIPVNEKNYELFDLNISNKSVEEVKRIRLINQQLRWLNSHKNNIIGKALGLYNKFINNKLSKNVVDRCCDFKLLETKCNEYNK